MRDFATGLAFALAVTGVELLLVGWLNREANFDEEQGPAQVAPIRVERPEPSSEVRDAAPRQRADFARPERIRVAPMKPVEPSAIAGLSDSHAPSLGALPSLPATTWVPSASDSSDGGPEQPPQALSRPAPEYPATARRAGTEGEVRLRLRVDETGRVVDAVVIESDPPGVFDGSALAAARRYRYSPARTGGEPVAATVEVRMSFRLER